jgi:hypothetical protein
MAYFDELLQRAITVRNNRAPASNTADLVGGVLVGIVTALQMLLDDKQDELTFDTEPTADSPNPVTSDGIYQALQAIDLSACEKIVNKVTSINAQSTDVQYPTAKLLYDSLQALSGIYAAIVHTHVAADITNLSTVLSVYELLSNKVAAVDAQSTDDQYPTAKLLFDISQTVDAYLANLDARVTSLENDPPVTYIICGTSSNVGGTETFRLRFIAKGASTPAPIQYITVDVNNVGYWEIKYVNKYVYSLREFAQQSATLLTCDFSQADEFSQVVEAQSAFYSATSLTNIKLSNATFERLTTAVSMFRNCSSLASVEFGVALNFASLTTTGLSARNTGMFQNCTALTALDFSNQTFAALSSAFDMFSGCTALASIDLSAATFGSLLYATSIFQNCTSLSSINLQNATFAALLRGNGMFMNCSALASIDLSAATFDVLENATSMFQATAITSIDLSAATFNALTNSYRMFRYCAALASIDLSAATFENVVDSRQMFMGDTTLDSILVTETDCAILPTSDPTNASIGLNYSQYLTYASMLAVANWLSNLTGNSAHTIIFNTTAWNNMGTDPTDTAQKQAAIDAILQTKNWTRLISN